jgi:hypothetical protein
MFPRAKETPNFQNWYVRHSLAVVASLTRMAQLLTNQGRRYVISLCDLLELKEFEAL